MNLNLNEMILLKSDNLLKSTETLGKGKFTQYVKEGYSILFLKKQQNLILTMSAIK